MFPPTGTGVVGLRPGALSNPSFGEVCLYMYFITFSVYWFWNLYSLVASLGHARAMREFYNSQLDISDDDLMLLSWAQVLQVNLIILR